MSSNQTRGTVHPMPNQKKSRVQKAVRRKTKLKIALSSPSGGGKTYGALLLAYGLVGDWDKVGVVDTENGSSALYADNGEIGSFNVVYLEPPYAPENYIEAIRDLITAGCEVVIIDSMSHEWDAAGGALDIQNQSGGRYQDWAKVTPRHQAFVDCMLQSPVHVIGTMRRKTDYELSDGGKKVTKVGMKVTQREGIEYEFTTHLAINQNHMAYAEKDRSGIFKAMHDFRITAEVGQKLREWSESGAEMPKPHDQWDEIYEGGDRVAQKKFAAGVMEEAKIDRALWAECSMAMLSAKVKMRDLKGAIIHWLDVKSGAAMSDEELAAHDEIHGQLEQSDIVEAGGEAAAASH